MNIANDSPGFDGGMSAKFWKLKQTDGGNTFAQSSQSTARAGDKSIDLVSGATIGGVYGIIELIGRGGMGEVYLARHKTLGRRCALKVIPPDQVTDESWQRFQFEARVVAKLDHANLIKVTDLGLHEGCLPFYAMDYVAGQNLADYIARKGPLPLDLAIEIFKQVCDGVECAHRSNILHRDLKPANIMLAARASSASSISAGRPQVKVLDFGLAKLTKQDRATQSLTAVGDVFGSPSYMSPEQCSGEKLDARSDLYSLGCTLFECLTGSPPFVGQDATSVIFGHLESEPPSLAKVAGSGKFPASMEVVMTKLLRKRPAERYQSMQELKNDLELVAAGKNVEDYVPAKKGHERTAQATGSKSPPAASAPAPAADTATGASRRLPVALISGGVFFLTALTAAAFYFTLPTGPAKTTVVLPKAPPVQEVTDYDIAGDTLTNEINVRVKVAEQRRSRDPSASVEGLVGSEVFFEKGLRAMESDKFNEGLKLFSQVLKLIPTEGASKTSWRAAGTLVDRWRYSSLAYQQRGCCQLQGKNYKAAIADFSKAIELRPDYSVNYVNRAKAHFMVGEKALGEADMRAAAQVGRPNSGDALP
ncbi:MAG: protein kinase [Cyanobacteria bacterium SZAS LIN-3]|nr:protein kinase [Cyanobacteria bacterium SZAS LIN-3]